MSDITALFDAEYAAMLRLATLLVGSVAVAEEVVQESFVAVDQRWQAIERPGGYLRTTVVRGCAAVLRRREIEHRHAPAEPEPTQLPTHLVELRDAIATLPDRQRIVIVLRYFVDLPDDEIAQLLDARPSTVRSLARRALAKLRKELE